MLISDAGKSVQGIAIN